MAHDATIIANRNKVLLADYNRLTAEEHAFRLKGHPTVYVRLKPEQIISILGKLYHLGPRRVEALVYPNAPKPVPLKTAA